MATFENQDLRVVVFDQKFEYLKQNLEEFDDLRKKHAKYKDIIAEQQRGILNKHNRERIIF